MRPSCCFLFYANWHSVPTAYVILSFNPFRSDGNYKCIRDGVTKRDATPFSFKMRENGGDYQRIAIFANKRK